MSARLKTLPLRRNSFSKPQLIGFALIFAAIGGYAIYRSFAAENPMVWVSTTGNDATCARSDQTKPCASFNRAYQVAVPGDTIEVAGGSYPAQRLVYDSTKIGAAYITFRPATGAKVVVSSLEFGQDQLNIQAPQKIIVQDMEFTSLNTSVVVWKTAADIILNNLNGRALQLYGPTKVRVNGGDWGKCVVTAASGTNCTSRMIGNDIVIDGAAFHDVIHDSTLDPENLNHTEGLFIRGCQDCTVTRSKFYRNTTFHIFIQNCCGLQPNQNVRILNSWFTAAGVGARGDSWTGANSIYFSTVTPGMVVAHNSLAENGTIGLDEGDWSQSGGLIVANYYMRGFKNCISGITYRNNVYRAFSQYTGQEACDPSEKKVTTFNYANYTQEADFDYHNTPSSPGIDFANPLDSPLAATDIDGQPWPSIAPDAGADEYVAGSVTPPTPPPPTPTPPPPTPSPTPPPASSRVPAYVLKADLNNDGIINIRDVSILLRYYRTSNPAADINDDGLVDIRDVSRLLARYLQRV